MALTVALVKFPQKDLSIYDVPLLLLPMYPVDLVPNVASNLWSAHYQKFGSVTVTGSTYMARTLLFLLFGSICAAAIENANNKSQSTFMKLTYVLIIFSNHILNSFGLSPFLLGHSTTAYVTTSSLGNLSVVKFVMLFAHIFNSKVVYYETEHDGTPFVLP